ncbi:hypothetical protein [Parenemella sanctibonifatiensis]|uniref:Uncharacterized protein n=1 Tax=Parenemella sanctibonifatiensis TaxID=2016505 RepID=A0A255EM22_9ACTN|nr:hypothetical protein [Parenemella sanctibonifatiensis]OYN92031.1 hypothetical protein CGZ91_00425 [Parenemella sanctibonifatiensis]
MAVYARPSWQLVRQVVADLFVVGWGAAWWWVSRQVHDVINLLADPAREMRDVAQGLRSNTDGLGEAAGDLPIGGDLLEPPFREMSGQLLTLEEAANAQIAAIETTATWVGWCLFLIPLLTLVAVWLPWRVSFIRRSAAAQGHIDSGADLDLYALRAMASQPMHKLAKIHDDPVAAWRSGDRATITKLADLEFRRAGLRAPKQLD